MFNVTQPLINLFSANAELAARFVQSPKMTDLAKASAQEYFELAQKTFGRATASYAHADVARQLQENYATFTREYSESLMGVAAEGQSLFAKQAQDASDRVAQSGQAVVEAVTQASQGMKQPRAK